MRIVQGPGHARGAEAPRRRDAPFGQRREVRGAPWRLGQTYSLGCALAQLWPVGRATQGCFQIMNRTQSRSALIGSFYEQVKLFL